MLSPLDAMIELRREAERAARARLERAVAARAAADQREACLVAIGHAARATLLRADKRRATGSTSVAQAQTQERHRARLRADARRATQELEQHRRGAQAAARGAEDEARAAYQAARVALAAAEKLAQRAARAAAQRARRRAEDAASDHAAHLQRARHKE